MISQKLENDMAFVFVGTEDFCKILASLGKSIVPWILPSHLILKGGLNASDVREKLFRLFHKSKSTWVPFGLDANFTRLRLSYAIKVEFVKGSTYENVLQHSCIPWENCSIQF